YSDPKIIRQVNTQYVPVRVDTDRRPDIEARYRHGGWPTTSVLLQTGEVLFQGNFLEPEELRAVLEESDLYYRQHKNELKNRAAEGWAKLEASRKVVSPPEGPVDPGMVDESLIIMRQRFDPRHGGFHQAPKFFEPDAVALALRQYYYTKNNELRVIAVKTLDAQLGLQDPVWGGFYRYAERADWTEPHYEKMLDIQARNLQNYLEAYQVIHDPTHRGVVNKTIKYVTRFLSSPSQAGFYASQDADARRHPPSSGYIEGEEYFLLGENRRIELGLPQVDRTVYTHWNGLMIRSYLEAYRVLGDSELRAFALKTLNQLYEERYKSDWGMAHVVRQGKPEGYGLLADQVTFAQALQDAFQTTAEPIYLKRAERLAGDLVKQLEDARGGGFFDRPYDSAAHGLLKLPHKPLKENLEASILFSDLFYLTEKPVYRSHAERTLQYVLGVSERLPVALAALAVDRFLNYPVHVVIVGSKSDRVAEELFRRALGLYAPGKVIRFLDPRTDSLAIGEVTFPRSKTPRAYICTDRLCSQPIGDPDKLEDNLHQLLAQVASASPPGQESPDIPADLTVAPMVEE
ncbi:MAG: thioredoxin domain-containing protein, partial [Nitrospiraceae bacterium]